VLLLENQLKHLHHYTYKIHNWIEHQQFLDQQQVYNNVLLLEKQLKDTSNNSKSLHSPRSSWKICVWISSLIANTNQNLISDLILGRVDSYIFWDVKDFLPDGLVFEWEAFPFWPVQSTVMVDDVMTQASTSQIIRFQIDNPKKQRGVTKMIHSHGDQRETDGYWPMWTFAELFEMGSPMQFLIGLLTWFWVLGEAVSTTVLKLEVESHCFKKKWVLVCELIAAMWKRKIFPPRVKGSRKCLEMRSLIWQERKILL
jgi:hypothetical protein